MQCRIISAIAGTAIFFSPRCSSPSRRQNRYKSILCQEDSYLSELVRYIHLNPLRAAIVKGLRALNKYPYFGHRCIVGKDTLDWQDTEYILKMFGSNRPEAIRRYREFVKRVLAQAKEDFERKHQLQSEGISFEHVLNRVAELLGLTPEPVLWPVANFNRRSRPAVYCVSEPRLN